MHGYLLIVLHEMFFYKCSDNWNQNILFFNVKIITGSLRVQPTSNSPEPPPPPPRNHDPSFNDSKDSNEISEAECDRDQLINSRTYGGKWNVDKWLIFVMLD